VRPQPFWIVWIERLSSSDVVFVCCLHCQLKCNKQWQAM
jgi:hypothetical protein